MDPRDLNKILLHTVPNGWLEKSYLQVWEFKGKNYKETSEMFEQI